MVDIYCYVRAFSPFVLALLCNISRHPITASVCKISGNVLALSMFIKDESQVTWNNSVPRNAFHLSQCQQWRSTYLIVWTSKYELWKFTRPSSGYRVNELVLLALSNS